MASVEPEARVHFPLMRQAWRCASFLHWDYPPHEVRRFIPAPFELHTYDERAWVGLTPFTTTLDVFGVLPVPGPRRFGETNLRTYVRGPDGGDGVWFLSLDVENAVNAMVGRLVVPYFWADLTAERDGTTVHYGGHRRTRDERRAPGYDVRVEYESSRLDRQSEFDVFLTGRWHAYVKRGPILGRFDVEHEPWPLHRAALKEGNPEHMLEGAGLPPPTEPPVVHYAPGVNASVSWPTLLRGGGPRD
jgi:uncharacterized protein YqjF (DUF2071 family)